MAIMTGTAGNNRLIGTDGRDTLLGNGGDDLLRGRGADDWLDGGAGFYDLASYIDSPEGVLADLRTGQADDGWGANDGLRNIEGLIGSAAGDTLIGNAGDNYLRGQDGADSFIGGDGFDSLEYSEDPTGIMVDLEAGTAQDGWGNTDLFRNIEAVTGSAYDDTLRGSTDNDVLRGKRGSDQLDGGGLPPVDGWIDRDWAEYTFDPAPIQADLASGRVADGWGDTDRLSNIEGLVGSPFADRLSGDGRDNWLRGRRGNDIIEGGGGLDRADYRDDPGQVVVDLGTGRGLDGWGDRDSLSGIEGVIGSRFDDGLTGTSGANHFEGRGGNDTINGAAGHDWVSYVNAPRSVHVDLATGTASGDGTDRLISIESVEGSPFADRLTGNERDNTLHGGPGNDTIIGGGGTDTLYLQEYSYSVSVRRIAPESYEVRGALGSDRVSGVERISLFDDPPVPIDSLVETAGTSSDLATTARMVAALNQNAAMRPLVAPAGCDMALRSGTMPALLTAVNG